MRKIIDITALSIAVCVLVMVLFLPSPVLSFKCYRGDGVSCAQLGRDKLSHGDYDGAKPAFAKACEAGEKDSCFDLGALYDGEGNATQAGVFYAAACDKNVAVACHKLGNLYQRGRLSRDFVAAAQRYARACDLGYAKSCHNAGVVYFTGGFGLAADQASHMADVFAVTATRTNTNVEMIGETMKYAAPVARAFGASME
ncbi:phage tail tape measure protein, partial [uncultured Campylobacter sp.]|uniref:phage tail tape measure protein n=1 Tax=uncultured Campylobacter sp. TaxID=218934 RepID=UPI002638AB20